MLEKGDKKRTKKDGKIEDRNERNPETKQKIVLNNLLHELTKLTNRLHRYSQHEALMNGLPVMIMSTGKKIFNTKGCAPKWKEEKEEMKYRNKGKRHKQQ